MTSVVVDFLLKNILEFVKYKAELIKHVKGDMEDLEKDLRLFQEYLKETSQRSNSSSGSATALELVNQIRQVTYKAEDAVEAYVCEASVRRTKLPSRFLAAFMHLPKLSNLGEEIKRIREEVRTIHHQRLPLARSAVETSGHKKAQEEKKKPIIEEEYVVGFEEEAEKIISLLTGGSNELKVVTIIGMPGLGKTTLANKVFKDRDLEFKFVFRSWVYVSKNYTRTEVFQKILKNFCGGRLPNYMYKMSGDELLEELHRRLEEHKYLIVLDDVWTKEAWNELQVAFPRNKNGSRIVLTTRQREVGVEAGRDGIHQLKFLEQEECLELLRWKVFREKPFPSNNLKDIGQTIAKGCGGLPLAVVIIAGIIKQKVDDTNSWEKIAAKVTGLVIREQEQCEKVVRWSYDTLSDDLKVCFLYFGFFREDYIVPAKKLMLLWIAEGFIKDNSEETAEEYLEKLVDKSLVIVDKRAVDGRIKTCNVHDMIHDLCKKLALEENLFCVITNPENYLSANANAIDTCRRLCLCSSSGVLDYIKKNPPAARVRSFLAMPEKEMQVPLQQTAFFAKAFQLLRVLDVTSLIFEKFPREIVALVLLRYVAMSINFKNNIIPTDISELWNLQILIIRVTTGVALDIKANIWEMNHLLHLQTNVPVNFLVPPPKTKVGVDELPSGIKVITSIATESCSRKVLSRIRNAEELGIQGCLEEFLNVEQKESSFGDFVSMKQMEKLTLCNDLSSGGKISGLPRYEKFPPHLKWLTLFETKLDWKHMITLGKLPKLMVLKLKQNAFMGRHWDTMEMEESFPCLEVLYIGKSDLEKWDASGDRFPCLKKLSVKYCEGLQAIPCDLAQGKHLSNLQILKVKGTNPGVAASARTIEELINQINSVSKLQISIFPPTHDAKQKTS